MSYKTDRLVDLFPDAYAAKETESLLYKLLDAVGAELMAGDETVKALLKSHWVDYASGPALDGLGAIYGVYRRLLRTGELESDDGFRQRLKSVVPLFTGGGTVAAVAGAVRSALGLPFNLDQLRLPPGFEQLRQDIADLVMIREFSPTAERVLDDGATVVNGATEVVLSVDIPAVRAERPLIRWTMTQGGGRVLSIERLDAHKGFISSADLIVAQGETLVLSAESNGHLTAVIGQRDVTAFFSNLDGSGPAIMPEVPTSRSDWKVRSEGARFDDSGFDGPDTLDYPQFHVEMLWQRYEPLTFEVHVPYFLQAVVADLARRRGYPGDLFVFAGLPPERIQEVVDQTRAAGVKASVHFSLNFSEDQAQREQFAILGQHHMTEDEGARENFTIGSVNRLDEDQGMTDRLGIAGVFDISPFDGAHVFA